MSGRPSAVDLRNYWLRTGHRDRLTRALDEPIRRISGVVLDVGGGRGAPHDASWGPGARRVRLDIAAAHRPDVIGDAAHLPVHDASVDAVAMVEVLEHVAKPWLVLDEIWRVLRPGGVLVGSAPLVWPIHGDPDDYFRFTDSALRVLLERFSSCRTIPIGGHVGAAWIVLTARFRSLRVANPLLRGLGRRPDARCPEGYAFIAKK
jgi:SAM-dependent methyltransferase